MSYIVNIRDPDRNLDLLAAAARYVREKYDIGKNISVGDRLEKELDIVILKTPDLVRDLPDDWLYIVDFKTEMNYTYQVLRWL